MDLPELRSTLDRLGLELPGPSSGVSIETRPARIVRAGDRGETETQSFPNEDALCRSLLVGLLIMRPVPVGAAAPDAPRTRPALPPVKVAKPGFWEKVRQQSVGRLAPTPAWSRALPVHSGIAARGQGLLLLTDTGALVEHAENGALHVTAVDIVTGAERWSHPIWPPAATRSVAVAGAFTVLAYGAVVCALDTATGALLWSRDRADLFEQPAGGPPTGVRVLAHDPQPTGGGTLGPVALLESGRHGHGTARLAAVALRTGDTVWTGDDRVSDPVFAHPPAVATPRLLRADYAGDRLTVTAVRLADRVETLVASVPVPASYTGGSPIVLADELDATATSGLVVVRFTRPPGAGQVGTRLGDVVLTPGRDEPLFAASELAPSGLPAAPGTDTGQPGQQLAYALSPDRYVVVGDDASRLFRADGSQCWSAPPGSWFRRTETATVHWPRSSKVEAITDDGAVAWSGRSGTPVLMRGRELWIVSPARMEGIDAIGGFALWRRDLRANQVRPAPNGTIGWSDADECVVILTSARLEVHRLA